MKACPFCKSKQGYYKKANLYDTAETYYNFDGEVVGYIGSDKNGNMEVKELKAVRCTKCNRKIEPEVKK